MTDNEMRIAIADLTGEWRDIVETVDARKELVGVRVNAMRLTHRGEYQDAYLPIPDYLNDLNAMHCMEKSLDYVEKRMMSHQLRLMINSGEWNINPNALFAIYHATARQRAEAFLRVKGLWK